MDTELIHTFLTLVQCRSFTTAADKLAISQSTLSHRLYSLENELQEVLVNRGRGKRIFSLTEAGVAFIPLAEQWMSLNGTILGFHLHRHFHDFRIGSVESMTFLFSSLFREFISPTAKHDPIYFTYYTYPSFHIYNEMEQHKIDCGFFVRQRQSKLLETVPLFSETHFVVGNLGTDKTEISPNELDVQRELLADWSPTFLSWHKQVFDSGVQPLADIGTSSALLSLLSKDTWSIIPESFAYHLEEYDLLRKKDLRLYRLTNPPPNRICYKVTHKYLSPSRQKLVNQFNEIINDFLNNKKLHL